MKIRFSNFLLALAFVGGVVLFPAWHQARCGDDRRPVPAHVAGLASASHTDPHSSHDAHHCQVCTLSAVAFDLPRTAVSPIQCLVPCVAGRFLALAPVQSITHRLPFSRGPPPVRT